MDDEMARIANAREKKDRALADAALADAANAARREGANDVAAALDAERRLLTRRSEQSDELRALADALRQAGALGDGAQRALDSLDREGSEASQQALARALAEAWSKLTPEERARVAAKMAKPKPGAASPARGQPGDPPDAKQIEDSLRAMADDDSETDEAQREGALDSAGAGASATEAELGGSGGGQPSGQPGKPGGGQNGAPSGGGNASGDGSGAGGSHDFGTGSHAGSTAKVDGDTLKSRAQAHMNAGAAMPNPVTTFSPGRTGDVATALSTGDLRAVGNAQMEGVEKSDVPEEYRDHVRQYFNPR
jgi:hypothetical protein